MDITTVGLDLAKHIFQVYGVAAGATSAAPSAPWSALGSRCRDDRHHDAPAHRASSARSKRSRKLLAEERYGAGADRRNLEAQCHRRAERAHTRLFDQRIRSR
jgi:hypothetical protein